MNAQETPDSLICLQTPVGKMAFTEENGMPLHLYFEDEIPAATNLCAPHTTTERYIAGQIDRFFNHPFSVFDFSLESQTGAFIGKEKTFMDLARPLVEIAQAAAKTPLQERVYKAVINIHYGMVCEPKDIANALHITEEQVKDALCSCPLPLIVPLHRIWFAHEPHAVYAQLLRDREKEYRL